MNLEQYQNLKGIKTKELATELDVPIRLIYSYKAKERIPRPDLMRNIYINSGGAIDPNSFYDINNWKGDLDE